MIFLFLLKPIPTAKLVQKKRGRFDLSVNRLKTGVNRPNLGVKRREPLLEFGYTRLTDDYFLGNLHRQVERKTAAKPYGNILYGLACDDELAVGAEELLVGQC